MSERFNEAVLKTVEGNTSGGSNPSLSAFARRSSNEVQSEGGLFVHLPFSSSAGFGGQSPLLGTFEVCGTDTIFSTNDNE
jgi:hypothetical protein